MNIKQILFALGCIAMLIAGCGTTKKQDTNASDSYVLLVSFDGMGHDYVERFGMKNFKQLAIDGASASYMIPSFPSKSFPNHYSIITGMYAGHHGLVDNNFLDKARNAYYSSGDASMIKDPYYYNGTPLWQWLQSKGMKTASLHWIGSESPIQGQHPTYYTKYSDNTDNEARIGKIIEWLSLPKNERPQFISAYFSLIDDEGHRTGSNSPEMQRAATEADRLLGLLITKVKALNRPIDIIVVSDHGIVDMDSSKDIFVNLETITQELGNKATLVNSGMQSHIYFNNEKDIVPAVKMLKEKLPYYVKVYQKKDIPPHWQYNHSPRVGDILLVADAPYYMVTSMNHPVTKNTKIWGTHGYDPYTTQEMRAVFYAVGNNIKAGYKVDAFENVNVFPLITKLLGVDNPTGIDGKSEVLAPIIKP